MYMVIKAERPTNMVIKAERPMNMVEKIAVRVHAWNFAVTHIHEVRKFSIQIDQFHSYKFSIFVSGKIPALSTIAPTVTSG